MRMVSGVLRAWCWLGLAASVLAANGPGQGGHSNGSSSANTAAPNHGPRGETVASRSGRERPTTRTRPLRVILPTASTRRLPSRRLAPFFGTVFGAEGFGWWGGDWRFEADAGDASEEPALLAPPDAASIQMARRMYAEPSSIQPLRPSSAGPAAVASAAVGKLQLEIQPPTAQVYVDGFFVGSVDALNGAGGLTVTAGWHRMEFRAPGYQTPAVNVTIEPNRTVALRLALRPIP
jgi:hypothetical protein